MSHPFRASQVIFVQLPESEEDQRYASRIVHVAEGRELWIGALNQDGEAVEVEPGTPVVLEVLLPDGIRRFPSVMQRKIHGSPPNLVVGWPRDIERIQRRNDVRVEVSVPVQLEPIGRIENVARRIDTTTIDLSAGGLRVVVSDALPEDIQIKLRLSIPGREPVLAHGNVLRCQEIDEPTTTRRFWAAIRFTLIDEFDRREITRYVFDIQRELLRRANPD